MKPPTNLKKPFGTAKAEPVEIVLEDEGRSGFDVRYDNGQTAEVSWAFLREPPPKPGRAGTNSKARKSKAVRAVLVSENGQARGQPSLKLGHPVTWNHSYLSTSEYQRLAKERRYRRQ